MKELFIETEILDNYKKAGAIWAKTIKFTQKKAVEEIKLLEIAKEFEELPFAERWLREKAFEKGIEEFQATIELKELMKTGCFKTYHGLKENKDATVTQVEKSILVLEGKIIALGK